MSISGATRQATFIAAMLTYLARRLDLPGLLELARDPISTERSGLNADLVWLLPTLFWDLPAPALPGARGAGEAPARHDWYNGMQWMIARCDPGGPGRAGVGCQGRA